MRALDPQVRDAIWTAIEGHLPQIIDTHPLGCHRRRASDRDCFDVILVRLVTGRSWEDAERLCGNKVSDTTVRARRDEWIAAGVFNRLERETLDSYDRVVGLDLSDVAVDASLQKSPCGGEGTGHNPCDRAKLGWKWSVLTDRNGIPISWVTDAANVSDTMLLKATLLEAKNHGLLIEVETLWLDRGYDSHRTRERLKALGITDAVIAKKRHKGQARGIKSTQQMGLRWPVERTNSWLSNYGQLQRNTDRRIHHRLAQFGLAVVCLLTAKLIDYRNRWSACPSPIR